MIANESAGLCRGSHPLLNNGERTVSGCIVDDDELDPGMGLIGNALQSCGDRSDFSPHWDDHAHQRICSHQGTIVVGSATHSENVFVDISVPVASALHTLRAITGHRWTSMTANDEGWIPCPICLRTRRAALSRRFRSAVFPTVADFPSSSSSTSPTEAHLPDRVLTMVMERANNPATCIRRSATTRRFPRVDEWKNSTGSGHWRRYSRMFLPRRTATRCLSSTSPISATMSESCD